MTFILQLAGLVLAVWVGTSVAVCLAWVALCALVQRLCKDDADDLMAIADATSEQDMDEWARDWERKLRL